MRPLGDAHARCGKPYRINANHPLAHVRLQDITSLRPFKD